jgi:hypothetical protein
MAPRDELETLLRDVVARVDRLPLAGILTDVAASVRSNARNGRGHVLTMLEPTQLASYSGPRAAVSWTAIQTGYPRADMAYVAVRCRDYGTTTHSASFQVRPDDMGYARTVASFAFPNGSYADKETTVFLFIELDRQGAFQYSIVGGFQEWDVTLHGLLESE